MANICIQSRPPRFGELCCHEIHASPRDDRLPAVDKAGSNAQMSVWVFTIHGGLRLCGDREPPHEQVASHLSTVSQAIQSFKRDPVGASCRLRWAGHCRIQLGTFSGSFVANCPPSLVPPLRLASKIYELQLDGPRPCSLETPLTY
jgi:hypothetical protein